ncbi:MAG TPA: glycosyltransferase [Flavobacteriaceae bacterium]|nr:glycosyltransferase [Flavobacteriaceae bacterium]
MQRHYSFIVPIYNRPEELQELLESMARLSGEIPFEIVVVEDGSTEKSDAVVAEFPMLDIRYFFKPNSGPGDSRNFGMRKATGDYFLILDSDVVLPNNYLQEVEAFLDQKFVDCFGGPDAAGQNFTPIQKAINYAMTSFLTTGGIRGNKKMAKNFEPRSFNMGISKKAFEATGGFGKIHPGEDPDLSIRIREKGFETAFAPKVFVFHKRRIDWGKFYVQVNKFGKTRPILTAWHPGSGKLAFWFPSLFVLGLLGSVLLALFGFYYGLLLYGIYFLIIFIDATTKNKCNIIGLLSVRAVLTQFIGYGLGFLKATFYIRVLKRDPKKVFPNLFFNS